MDRDGYLFITGRSKEVIVLSSEKTIYRKRIENLYLGSSLIKESGILGIESQGITESVHAVVRA